MPDHRTAYQGQALTSRELEIIGLVAEGNSNKIIGRKMGLSDLTIKSHLARIGKKIGTGDRAGIVATAIRADLLHIWPLADLVTSPVICHCARCQNDLETCDGPASEIATLQIPKPRS